MYKINIYDVDGNDNFILQGDCYRRYEYKSDAKSAMMEAMMTMLNALVDVRHETKLFCNAFTMHLNETAYSKIYDGVIRLWNIPDNVQGEPMTLFEIEWVNEDAVDKFNKQLKDTYGEDLTLWIREETTADCDYDGFDCDGNCEGCEHLTKPKYYYEGVTCGCSKNFDTPEEAHKEACAYLDNIELYISYD